MKTKGLLIAALAASTAIAGCSSNGSGGGQAFVSRSGNTDAQKVLAVDKGSAAAALNDGSTLRASQRTSASWTRVFQTGSQEGTASLSADGTGTIKRNSSGGLDLTVGGQTYSFSAADVTSDGYGFVLPDGSAGIFTNSANSMADALDPANTDYSAIFDYYADQGSTGLNGHIVVGTETADTALATLPTATYSGRLQVRAAPTTGFNDYNNDVTTVRGDASLTANFGSGTVAGNVTNLGIRAPNNINPTGSYAGVAGNLTLGTANINGNGFTGGMSGDADFNANIATLDASSTYSGTFFGPAAEEVAGGVNMTGTAAGGGAFIGEGYLQLFKN